MRKLSKSDRKTGEERLAEPMPWPASYFELRPQSSTSPVYVSSPKYKGSAAAAAKGVGEGS